MEDQEGEMADIVNEEAYIEDKGSEIDQERSQTTEYPSQSFATRSEKQDLIVVETKKYTNYHSDSWFG